ncbi:hypothetical protein [Methanobrevibacter sp.]|uniref:hypothetical protein n=1 Tax=Methanobrevibacter sp. TaxID=66852 RepID=UPI00388E85E3
MSVCASDFHHDTFDIKQILDETDDSDLTGCCSVVLQLDGNNSIFSFRRDANLSADIHIEAIDWHGVQAIKQWKVDGGYFCQVIITEDGWVIGYGGIDDGIDNEIIENITAGMINNESKISEADLEKIQEIKAIYELGHVVIKAPDGHYGVATATNHFTGKLKPGEYISMPNRYKYSRSGEIPLNTTDKISVMTELAASDMFGLTRRDITTYYFHHDEGFTTNQNVVDVYLSNDDGSLFNMNTGNMYDDVYFQDKVFKGEDIPISPEYESMGSIVIHDGIPSIVHYTIIGSVIALIGVLSYGVYYLVRKIRH